jgi:hypothetical protein
MRARLWPAGSPTKLSPFLLAAAYANAGYSGDDTQYWGGPAVRARRNLFGNATASDPSWSNMDAYRCAARERSGGSCAAAACRAAPLPAAAAAHRGSSCPRACRPWCPLPASSTCLPPRPRSWHSYGKTGSQLATSYNTIKSGLVADNAADLAPIWITEHQSKTSSGWDVFNSTTDSDFEASRVASQAMWMVSVGGARPRPRPRPRPAALAVAVPAWPPPSRTRAAAAAAAAHSMPRLPLPAHANTRSPLANRPPTPPHPTPAAGNPLAFKFSLTPSSSSSRPLSKNGVHWAENAAAPYHVTDSTLSAEAIRLVNAKLSGGRPLLDITLSSTGSTKTYFAVKEGGAYYLVTVNDNANPSPLSIVLSAWGIAAGTRVRGCRRAPRPVRGRAGAGAARLQATLAGRAAGAGAPGGGG